MISAKEFFERIDKGAHFSEKEREDFFYEDLIDQDDDTTVTLLETKADTFWGRWNHTVINYFRVNNRYFCISGDIANTEYQESYFEVDPIECKMEPELVYKMKYIPIEREVKK